MRAGLLQEIITIYTPSILKDEYGEDRTEYKKKCSTRARLIHNNGNKGIQNYEMFYSHTKTLQVRHYVNIKNFDRIEWNGDMYNVIDIEPNKDLMMQQIIIELIND